MTNRYTKVLLSVIAIASTLLLTSCSNPDTSGGVTLSRGGGDDGNEFPHGDCDGPGENTHASGTGCGWIYANERRYYIMPGANLTDAYLWFADLTYANLWFADLTYANLQGADLNRADLRGANLRRADLQGADLNRADLRGANLRGANLTGVKANYHTTCPNGKKWRTAGNDCGF